MRLSRLIETVTSIIYLFSNIFERLTYEHVTQFINKPNLLYKYTYGFRRDEHLPNNP